MRWRRIVTGYGRSAAGRNGSTDEYANTDSDRNAYGGTDMDLNPCVNPDCFWHADKHADLANGGAYFFAPDPDTVQVPVGAYGAAVRYDRDVQRPGLDGCGSQRQEHQDPMKKPTNAERQAHKALPHDSILGSLSPAVASECGAGDAGPAPPHDQSPADRTSPKQGTSLYAHRGTGDRARPEDLSTAPSAPAVSGSDLSSVCGAPPPGGGGHFLYRYAKVSSRTDSPDIAPLLADGWTIAHEDPRYGTLHLRKELPDALPRARRPRDCGYVDRLHAARSLVLYARTRTTHAAVMGIAALLAALVLLGCAFLALEAWNRLESAGRQDGIEMSR
jgi:hypothetical protein